MDEKKLLDEKKKIDNALFAIKNKREKEALLEQQKYVGKCFLFKNSDGTNRYSTYMQVLSVYSVSLNIDGTVYHTSITTLEVDFQPKNYSIKMQNFGSLEMWLDNPVSLKQFVNKYNRVLSFLDWRPA